uniref:Uncharacterized protein n=1 Tax=Romanomermis culicivorax TaxID=13658 RepID=A0A915JWB7_ROMCU
MVIFINLTP